MNIAIHGKIFSSQTRSAVQQIIDTIKDHGADVLLSAEFYDIAAENTIDLEGVGVYRKKEELAGCQAFISMGGDGTFLESLTHIGSLETPVLGINTGRLGVLATRAQTSLA